MALLVIAQEGEGFGAIGMASSEQQRGAIGMASSEQQRSAIGMASLQSAKERRLTLLDQTVPHSHSDSLNAIGNVQLLEDVG